MKQFAPFIVALVMATVAVGAGVYQAGQLRIDPLFIAVR